MTYPGTTTLPANPRSFFFGGGGHTDNWSVIFTTTNLIRSHLKPSVASFPLFSGCRPGYSTCIQGPTPLHLQCPPQLFCLSISPLLSARQPTGQPPFSPRTFAHAILEVREDFLQSPCLINSYSFFRSVKLPLPCETPDKTANSCIFFFTAFTVIFIQSLV